MHTRILTTGLLLLALTAYAEDKGKKATPAKPPEPAAAKPAEPAAQLRTPSPAEASLTGWAKAAMEGKDLYATFETTEGTFVVQLFSKDAPKTVAHFVSLAAGEKEWKHPATLQMTKRPLYDGTIFYRVIPNEMIKGGDPKNTGFGGQGYKFEDGFQSGRKFDKPGILAMDDSGDQNTNGSQFFITVAPISRLNNHPIIVGEVVKNYDVVEKITKVRRGPYERPLNPIEIKKVTISDKKP